MRGVLRLTLPELASVLDPPVTAAQLQHLVAALGLQPCGYRRNGQPGRPLPVYEAREIMLVHSAVAPWLAVCGTVTAVTAS